MQMQKKEEKQNEQTNKNKTTKHLLCAQLFGSIGDKLPRVVFRKDYI